MLRLGLWTNVSRVARERLFPLSLTDAARKTGLCPTEAYSGTQG